MADVVLVYSIIVAAGAFVVAGFLLEDPKLRRTPMARVAAGIACLVFVASIFLALDAIQNINN
jgi:hypothetical protein